jgi:hypothetical protein
LILRPTWSARLSFSLFFFAVAALFLGLGIRDSITRGSDLWFPAVFALTLVAVGVIAWSASIQADDTTIVVRFGLTRRYERREVAGIGIGGLSISRGRPVRFLRSDGSVLFTTIAYMWGNDQLQALATYLGVPIGRS